MCSSRGLQECFHLVRSDSSKPWLENIVCLCTSNRSTTHSREKKNKKGKKKVRKNKKDPFNGGMQHADRKGTVAAFHTLKGTPSSGGKGDVLPCSWVQKQLFQWACGHAAPNKSNFPPPSLSHWRHFHWVVKSSFWFTPVKVNMGSAPVNWCSVFVPVLQGAAAIQYPIQFAKWTWNGPEHPSVQGAGVAYRPLEEACDVGTVWDGPSLVCSAAFQTKLHFPPWH